MSRGGPAVTAITTGTRIVYDGKAWTVAGFEPGRLVLKTARGKTLLADTAAVLADPLTRLPGIGGDAGPAGAGRRWIA